jgi:D-xylose transport system permease protein
VTLAVYLSLQGVLLVILGDGGAIAIAAKPIFGINNYNLSVWAGWLLFAVSAAGYAILGYVRIRQRRRSGLATVSYSVWALKSLALTVMLGIATYYLNQERSFNAATSIKGVPQVVVLMLILTLGLTFLLVRTSFGRHVYAIGGNTEAARRAGINVKLVKTICFVICSTMAAVAGILFASRNGSVSPSTGGDTTLLLAVGAAVIGGCSLFGGKGRVIDAVIGGLVVAVISNGMLLLGLSAAAVDILTGLVLLVAATVDSVSRRRAQASG